MKIALAGDKLALTIPSPSGRSRDLIIPITLDGLKLIQKILREQAATPLATIGTPASPTQRQAEDELRAMKKEFDAKQEAENKKIADKHGINLSELGL